MIQDPVALTAFMLLVVAFARLLEAKVELVKKISSAVVCTLLGILLGNLGVIPHNGPVNEAVNEFAVPYSIVLVILASNLGDLKVAGARLVGCFVLATVATFAGSIVSGVIFASWLGPETWKLSGQFAGAFVGGGMNFVAIGRELKTSPSLFAAASVVDNLSTVPYILVQVGLAALLTRFYVGRPVWHARRRARPNFADESADRGSASRAAAGGSGGPRGVSAGATDIVERDARRYWTDTEISITDLALLAAAPLGAIWLARKLSPLLPGFPIVLWLTTLALVVAQFPFVRRLKGASVLSYFALHLFFIVIGAGSVFAEVVKAGPGLAIFMIAIIAIHVVIVYGVGWLVGLDIPNLSVASQAAVGGPGSALALSLSMKWTTLVTPGIIVGIFGYAFGNYVGFACAFLLRGLM